MGLPGDISIPRRSLGGSVQPKDNKWGQGYNHRGTTIVLTILNASDANNLSSFFHPTED